MANSSASAQAAAGSDDKVVRCLVVGETADGKSSLLDALLDDTYYSEFPDERPKKLDMGSSDAKGVTHEITSYRGMKLPGTDKHLELYDTPGVGTEQCPIEEIMASIRTKFEKNIKFQCILTTAPATTTTPGAGGRIVKLLLNEGLCGDEVERLELGVTVLGHSFTN